MEPVDLEPVDAVTVTSLVDNFTDMTLLDQGPAKRLGVGAGPPPTIAARFSEDGRTLDAPLAEHGFSALLTVRKGEREHRILFDAGLTPDGLVENMRRLGLSPKDVELIVLSHGHFDHTTGLDGLVRSLGRANLPVYIHPEFWSRRRIVIPGREPLELPTASRQALLDAGLEITEEQRPSFLLGGSVLITGEVDRTTEFEKGFPIHQAFRDGDWQPDPLILDDQALVIHVRDKGLLVMTGCGHAGVVNTLRHVRRLVGEERLYAVIGGFHLGGPMFEPIIPATVDALAELAPQVVVPAHCTGLKATTALAQRFPQAFIQNAVGTRYEL